VADPAGVLSGRTQWPTHICPGVAYASTLAWAEDRAQRLYGSDLPSAVADWMQSYPLPVGRWSLPAGVPALLAPLPGYGKAAIILMPSIPFTEARAFGIVDDHPFVSEETGGAFDLMPKPMQFLIAGWSGQADTFRNQAARWWDTMGRISVTGRPPGSTRHSMNDYKRFFSEVSDALGRPPRSLDEFVAQASASAQLSRDTVKRNLNDWGTSWGSFREEHAKRR